MAAVKYGQSIDTSMGFTPLEGLLMGTRSGDLDPQLILYIMGKEGLTLAEATTLLNKHSGLMGMSGVSSDMREVEIAMEKGNERAKLAFDSFCYRIKKYLGAYAAAMGGVDAIVFSGGIGENSVRVRKAVSSDLSFLGAHLDIERNLSGLKERIISTDSSNVVIGIIPTNEELVIALDTMHIVHGEEPLSMKHMKKNKISEAPD